MLLHPVEQALVNSQSILKWPTVRLFRHEKPNGFQSVLRTAWNQWGWWHPPLGTTSCKLLPPGTQYLFNKWRHSWKCRQKSLIFLDCRFDGPVGSEGFWKKRKNSLKELWFLCLRIPHSPWHNENSSIDVDFFGRLNCGSCYTTWLKPAKLRIPSLRGLPHKRQPNMQHGTSEDKETEDMRICQTCSRVNWIWDLRFSNSNTTNWKLAFQPTSSITSLQSAEDGHRTFQLGEPLPSRREHSWPTCVVCLVGMVIPFPNEDSLQLQHRQFHSTGYHLIC